MLLSNPHNRRRERESCGCVCECVCLIYSAQYLGHPADSIEYIMRNMLCVIQSNKQVVYPTVLFLAGLVPTGDDGPAV